MNSFKFAEEENDFYKKEIKEISKKTNLSEFALYTRLKIDEKISSNDYEKIKTSIYLNIKKIQEEKKEEFERKKELAEEQGKPKPFIPSKKPIESNLFNEILCENYFCGNIDKFEICQKMNKSFDKVEEVLYS